MDTGVGTVQVTVWKLPYNMHANFVLVPVQFPFKLCVNKPLLFSRKTQETKPIAGVNNNYFCTIVRWAIYKWPKPLILHLLLILHFILILFSISKLLKYFVKWSGVGLFTLLKLISKVIYIVQTKGTPSHWYNRKCPHKKKYIWKQ